MTFKSTGGRYSVQGEPKLRRLGVAAVVLATHVVFVLVLITARGARRPADAEVVTISFFPLPITEEERPGEKTPPAEPGPPVPGTSGTLPVPPLEARTSESQSTATEPEDPQELQPPESPSRSIDWQAELTTAASAMDARARSERERRSFSRPPAQAALTPRRVKPPCPFERCEPGWGAAPGIFDSTTTKKGRVENNPDGEVIRWISNYCYQILISANEFNRGKTRCTQGIGKNKARGDLFDHMRDVPEPQERAMDVP